MRKAITPCPTRRGPCRGKELGGCRPPSTHPGESGMNGTVTQAALGIGRGAPKALGAASVSMLQLAGTALGSQGPTGEVGRGAIAGQATLMEDTGERAVHTPWPDIFCNVETVAACAECSPGQARAAGLLAPRTWTVTSPQPSQPPCMQGSLQRKTQRTCATRPPARQLSQWFPTHSCVLLAGVEGRPSMSSDKLNPATCLEDHSHGLAAGCGWTP